MCCTSIPEAMLPIPRSSPSWLLPSPCVPPPGRLLSGADPSLPPWLTVEVKANEYCCPTIRTTPADQHMIFSVSWTCALVKPARKPPANPAGGTHQSTMTLPYPTADKHASVFSCRLPRAQPTDIKYHLRRIHGRNKMWKGGGA